jgi:hypothetical protein
MNLEQYFTLFPELLQPLQSTKQGKRILISEQM